MKPMVHTYCSSNLITMNGGQVWLPCHLEINLCNFFVWFYKLALLIELMAVVIQLRRKFTTAHMPLHGQQGCHLRSVGARRETWNNVHPENSWTLGASIQNLITVVTWQPGLVHPWWWTYMFCQFYRTLMIAYDIKTLLNTDSSSAVCMAE